MKDLLWVCCICLFALPARAQDEFEKANGLGVVVVNLALPATLEFYEKLNSRSPYRQVKLLEQNGVLLNDSDGQWLKPHRSLPYECSFICLALQDNNYKVIVNSETGATLWLRNKTFLRLMPWPAYLQQCFPLRRLDVQYNPVRKQPQDDAATVALDGSDCFRIINISGNWVQVEAMHTDDCSLKGKALYTGWIKWRDERNLMVSY